MNDTTEDKHNKPGASITPRLSASTPPPARAATPSKGKPRRSIDFLLDIPIELTVEVGRRLMTMGELIELTPGTVVEFDRGSGEHLDIIANGKLVARGEAVVVGDRYGVRVMEIIGGDPFAQVTVDNDKEGDVQ